MFSSARCDAAAEATERAAAGAPVDPTTLLIGFRHYSDGSHGNAHCS
jgi:hypothetical protein